ncbi:MAG: hypothetical protein JSW40_01395 [Candidatus Omnitrophota bacterium]|nr:MAG: hypothetical protein JSW40_01395 [Candidatus Omnitrophota bacterium]
MKYIVNIVAILLVVILVFAVIEFKDSSSYYALQKNFQRLLQPIQQFFKVKKHNISMEVSPERQPPLTFIEQEANLREFVPDVFGKFDERDWQQFWSLIYLPTTEKQGLLAVKRYRTKEEIEDYLRDRYPRPLSYFRGSDWDELWRWAKISWEE